MGKYDKNFKTNLILFVSIQILKYFFIYINSLFYESQKLKLENTFCKFSNQQGCHSLS